MAYIDPNDRTMVDDRSWGRNGRRPLSEAMEAYRANPNRFTEGYFRVRSDVRGN